jgi:phosphatidate cytidylyltransferase
MTRLVSAVILIAILIVTLWWLPWWATVVLTGLIAAVAAHELSGLAAAATAGKPSWFAAIPAVAAVLGAVLSTRHGEPIGADGLVAVLLASAIAGFLVVLASGEPKPATIASAAVIGLAPIYIGLPLGVAAALHASEGPAALGWLVAVIAGSDSAQYYTGRALGRRKLAPRISPAKTVEGAIGGLVAAAIIGAAVAPWTLPGVSPIAGGAVALLLAGFGIAGDLFESLLKRSAGVKDSSTLIPGHGGVLDRIDSYLFALPPFYLFLRYLA